MNVVLFVLDEPIYMPAALDALARRLGSRIACVIAFPPPRHGGGLRALLRRAAFLGLRGSLVLGWRALRRQVALGERRHLRSVAAAATRHGLPVYRFERVGAKEVADALARHPAELLVSLSCPQILGAGVRSRFPKGAINVHSAPLPRYRGLMPSFWILARGEQRTAVTVHDIVDALDAGDILVQRGVAIAPDESWDSLVRKTKAAGVEALLEAIHRIESGSVERSPNRDEESTTFKFPTTQDARDFRAHGGRMA